MSLAANVHRAIAVSLAAAARLRQAGNEVDLHLAVRHEVLAEELVQKVLDEDLDVDMIAEDEEARGLPEDSPEVDREMMEELEHMECQDCLQVAPVPQGIPVGPGGPSAVPTTLSGGITIRDGAETDPKTGEEPPKRKVEKRKYLACSQPKLARARGGKKVWMSICAYQVPPSKKTRMIAKIVSRNSTFKPRHLLEGGRKIPFVTEMDIDEMASRE